MSFGIGVGDIIAVANIANKVRKRFVDSPSQFKAVADEVKSLSNVLRDLDDIIPERIITNQQKADLEDTLHGCRNILTDLDRVLDKYHDLAPTPDRTGLAQKSRRFWKRLTFEPEDVSDLRSRLMSNIGLLNAFMGSLALGLSHATKFGVDRLNSYQDKEEYLKVLDWLSSTDFPAQQKDIYKDCQEGTGQWLLQSNEYQKWIDCAEPTLFCPGIPGAGKTFLTSIVIHDLHERSDGDPEVAVTCLYFNYKRQAEQTIENLLASLVKQLVQERSELYSNLESLYTSHNERRTRPSVDELSKILHAAINRCTKAFIVIDALDECTDSKTRLKLLKEVTALQAQESKVQILTTSRFIPDIVAEFDGKPTIEIRADDGDVRRYLEHHLEDLPLCVQRNQLLQATIVTEIGRAVEGMFLLAQLHLGSLSDKTTVKAVKVALQQLPKGSQGLDTAYDKTTERIDNQQPGFQQLAKQTLSWIVYATRQLSLLELRHALAVEDKATELDEENLAEADEIVSACAGLVTIERDTDIIRLVHYTTQEYLERKFLTWEPFAEEALTRTCLNYLSFDVFTTKDPGFPTSYPGSCRYELVDAFKKAHFLDYAVDAWHNHAEHCWNDVVEKLVFSFLEGDPQILNYGALRYIEVHDKFFYPRRPEEVEFATMHIVALFGLDRIAAALLQAGYDTQVESITERTPLTYAAEFGNEAVAKLLLKDVNVCDKYGYTPLHLAAEYGHENIVKLLLECEGINVNAQGSDTRFEIQVTPLNFAIEYGHEKVVSLLLERDDIDLSRGPLGNRNTALMSCAVGGSEDILQGLIERDDVDLNCGDDEGNTALMIAARYGNEEVFKRLLECSNVEVQCKNLRNQTPLMLAAEIGEKEIVELLLDREDTDVNCKDDEGQTALMWAASLYDSSGISIIRKLLKREEIDVNCQDNEGRTALMTAAKSKNYEVVKRLLMKEKIDVNCRNKKSQTVLMIAAQLRTYKAVEEFLMREEIDVNCQDNKSRTALMLAISSKNYVALKSILLREEIDVNCRDKDGRTALMLAASSENYDAVEILLQRDGIDLTGSDEDEESLKHAIKSLSLSI